MREKKKRGLPIIEKELSMNLLKSSSRRPGERKRGGVVGGGGGVKFLGG